MIGSMLRLRASRGRMLPAALAGLAILAAAPSVARAADTEEEVLKKLAGTWLVIAANKDGKELSEEEVKKERPRIKFDGKTAWLLSKSDNKLKTTVKLDPSKDPPHIDFLRGDKVMFEGVYKINGENLGITLSEKPGQRPEKVGVNAADVLFMVLKKGADEEVKDDAPDVGDAPKKPAKPDSAPPAPSVPQPK